jgi:hypothetical protein
MYLYKSMKRLPKGDASPLSRCAARWQERDEEIDLPKLWSSYEGQTVDALAVGGDEGRG